MEHALQCLVKRIFLEMENESTCSTFVQRRVAVGGTLMPDRISKGNLEMLLTFLVQGLVNSRGDC